MVLGFEIGFPVAHIALLPGLAFVTELWMTLNSCLPLPSAGFAGHAALGAVTAISVSTHEKVQHGEVDSPTTTVEGTLMYSKRIKPECTEHG